MPSPVDATAVRERQDDLRRVAREIAALVRGNPPPAEFFGGFLPPLVAGLEADGGAVWTTADKELRVEFQIGLERTGLVADEGRCRLHAGLLSRVMAQRRPLVSWPATGREQNGHAAEAGNTSEYVLLVTPLGSEAETFGVVELFLFPDASEAAQRGRLRFLSQMGDLAGAWFQGRRLQHYGRQETQWGQWQVFARDVHDSLELKATAATVANEGRRLLDCDRVSVLVRRGSKYRTVAVGGLDAVDRRAATIRELERLAAAVAAGGETLWSGAGDDTRDLAPQVERTLESYLDQSHTKLIGVIPLGCESPSGGQIPSTAGLPRTRAASVLVVERLEEAGDRQALQQQSAILAPHATAALRNAAQHEGLFLMPLWRALGRLRWLVEARTLPKTLAVGFILAAAVAALFIVPAEFALEARGTLVPVVRREVFAQLDGDIQQVHVRHGQRVAEGDLLVEMRNADLDIRGADLLGQQRAGLEELRAVEQSLLGEGPLGDGDRVKLHGERLRLVQELAGVARQLELHQRQRAELRIASPIAGQVVTWAVDDLLIHRPVHRGDVLLSIVAPDGEWELELRFPEAHAGHVDAAVEAMGAELPVRYVVATDPGRELVGTVREIHRSAEIRGEDGNTILIRVAIDRRQLAHPRYGAEVTARIHCGRRALGYVWLHDVIAFVHRRILFRL
jgi:hypothetical protein